MFILVKIQPKIIQGNRKPMMPSLKLACKSVWQTTELTFDQISQSLNSAECASNNLLWNRESGNSPAKKKKRQKKAPPFEPQHFNININCGIIYRAVQRPVGKPPAWALKETTATHSAHSSPHISLNTSFILWISKESTKLHMEKSHFWQLLGCRRLTGAQLWEMEERFH